MADSATISATIPDAPRATNSWAHRRPRPPARGRRPRLAAARHPPRSRSSRRALSNLASGPGARRFVVIDEDGARRAAAALPSRPRGPLHGVPVAVKDLIDVAGLPTALGRSRARMATTRRRDRRQAAGGRRGRSSARRARTSSASARSRPARATRGTRAAAPAARAAARRSRSRPAPPARARDRHRGQRADPGGGVRRGRPLRRSGLDADRGVSILAPQLRPARPRSPATRRSDLAVAWTALGGSDRASRRSEWSRSPRRRLGRVEPDRLADARDAARHLSARPVELAEPSLPAFGPPRATSITAEAAARHDARDGRRPGAARTPGPRTREPTSAPPAHASTTSARALRPSGRRRRPRHPHPTSKPAVLGRARAHRRPAAGHRPPDPALRPGQQLGARRRLRAERRAASSPRASRRRSAAALRLAP